MSAPGPRVVAWLDASAGIAGDMLLGALLDLGAELEAVQTCVDAVVPGCVHLSVSEVTRAGLRAVQLRTQPLVTDQPHRAWAEIRQRLEAAELPERTRERALAAFTALAEAEAAAHGGAVDDVSFHEVGAWDSIADVVGVCAALEDIGIDELVVSRIAVGAGTVRAAHGVLPVPGPAVAGLLTGWEVEAVGDGELATPTGVALATTLAAAQGPVPALQVLGVGVGAGSRDVEGRANVTRVVLGVRAPGAPSVGADGLALRRMALLEANVDDLDPRVWPGVIDALLEAGAADAWLTPVTMKRGRPAYVLSVLADPGAAASLRGQVMALTSTIGLRETAVDRWELPRGWTCVDVDGHDVRVKIAHREGRIVRATPEFRDVARAAAALSRPVVEILRAAEVSAVGAGLVTGADVPARLHG